jgi:hypothetical protein
MLVKFLAALLLLAPLGILAQVQTSFVRDVNDITQAYEDGIKTFSWKSRSPRSMYFAVKFDIDEVSYRTCHA